MNEATTIFEKFKGLNILVVGDVMIDRYLTGAVNRISPEAPVPVVNLKSRENRLGGAANVALNIAVMGANPILASIIGEDENATTFVERMKANGLTCEGIIQSKERKTTVKTRVIASNQQLLRVDSEDTFDLTERENEKLVTFITNIFAKAKIDGVLFQDYNKGVLTENLIEKITHLAKAKNITTTVDPKNKNFFAFKGVTLFKPNLKEIRDNLDSDIQPELNSLTAADAQLRNQLSHQNTMITLSEKGIFFSDGEQSQTLPTFPRVIADVSGAGDTVISIATLCLAAGLDLKTGALLSNLAGGQVCEKVGVVPVDREQLLEEAKAIFKATP